MQPLIIDDELVDVKLRRSTRERLKKIKGHKSYDDLFEKVLDDIERGLRDW